MEEPATTIVRDLLVSDAATAGWWATPVAAASAFAPLRRMGGLTDDGEQAARNLETV